MAVNPTTGIDPEVDRFVIWRPSTSQYTNMNATWPRTDGGQLVGANPDFEYYKKVVPSPPDIDHRYTLTTTYSRVATTPTPDVGLPQGTYEASFQTNLLPLEDLIAQIETEFQRQVRLQFPDTENPSTLIMAAKAIAKKQSGAQLTADEQALLDTVAATGDKVTQLAERRQELIDAATASEDYDITVWPTLS